MADVDHDNKLEVLLQYENGIDAIYAFNEDGRYTDGYAINHLYSEYAHDGSFLIVADTNEDGVLEIYMSAVCHLLYLLIGYKEDGTILPNFPIDLKVNGGSLLTDPVLILADIDGDNEMEILAAANTCEFCAHGVIIAFNLDGPIVEGFPIIEWQSESYESITIGDLDEDGNIEICVATIFGCNLNQPNYLYCYDLPYPYNSEKVAWKDTSNSPLHTNRYFNLKVKPPVVESVELNTGSFKWGTRVVIKGEHFQEGAKVFFGGIGASNVDVINSNTIHAINPAHKPCFGYINDLSVSPYELSFKMINQPIIVIVGQEQLGGGRRIEEFYSSSVIGNYSSMNGCLVNVIVAHPSLDQRGGVLRAAFIYTGWEPIRDDITLFVSKHVGKATFENGLAYWNTHMKPGCEHTDCDYSVLDSWHVAEDGKSNCIQRYGGDNKFIWFGKEDTFNYFLGYGVRNRGCVESPVIYIEGTDSALSFWCYRDVELNYLYDIAEVKIKAYDWEWHTIWHRDSRDPSEKEWVWSGWIPLSQFGGKYAEVRFCFDSVVTPAKNYLGWAIDDVQFRNVRWRQETSEIILEWQGGIPKYFVYRSKGADYNIDVPELRGYTSLHRYVGNSYNNDENYYYKVR